jgi:hypothetical protein
VVLQTYHTSRVCHLLANPPSKISESQKNACQ